MSPATMMRFLLGQEAATREVAANPNAVVIGVLFCLLAGVVRHGRDHDFILEPWMILAPLAASLVTSIVLYAVVVAIGRVRARSIPRYCSFLALYWATAPLALLRLFPIWLPVDTFVVDLLIAIWRATLTAQSLSAILPCALGVADVVVALHAVGFLLVWPHSFELTFQSLSPWIFVFIAAHIPRTLFYAGNEAKYVETKLIPIRSWCIAISVFALWPLLATQPKHWLAYRLNQAYVSGRIADASSLVLSHSRSDFPPRWRPLAGLSNQELIADSQLPRMLMAIATGSEDVVTAYRQRVDRVFKNDMLRSSRGGLPFRLEFEDRALVRIGKTPCANGEFARLRRDVGVEKAWVTLVFLGEQDKICCMFSRTEQTLEIRQDRLQPGETTRIRRP